MSEPSLRAQLQRAELERARLENALRDSNHRLATALTQVRQMQHELSQHEQLRAVGQMASGVAHDFNNDLAMIVGFTDILLKHPENLQMIRSVAGDATSLVDRLRDFIRQREEGTAVVIHVPLEAPEAAAEEPAAAHEGPTAPRRILVVEDEAPLRRILREYLAHAGHSVELTANGREGLDRFLEAQASADASGRFDLVVTDLAMPEMNGDQLALAVKATSPAIPVILLTGFGEIMLNSGEMPPGVDLVVPKPFSLASLQRAVATIV
jgi:CheY-like chemotaxis protein